MDIKIIYEDQDVVAVNKPAGVVVHPDKTHRENSLIQEIIKIRPEVGGVGDEPEFRPGVVHRLDKDTSGVLIVAKNQRAFEYLKSLFQKKEIIKKYLVLVEGNLKTEKGVIDLPIGRSKSDFRKKLASTEARGELREAVTEYKVLEKFPNYTLVEAYPKTGRTHQIRVHFKAIGHAVACDSLYGGRKSKCPEGLNRHFLHANFLELNLLSGTRVKLEADLPPDLDNTLAILRQNK